MPDMQGKTVVVTGGNSGIGFETAAALASMGARVLVTARNADKGRAAVSAITQRTGGEGRGPARRLRPGRSGLGAAGSGGDPGAGAELDVLVNNAGLVLSERAETVDGYEATFATNHLGPFLLTNLLLDRITASAPSRVVNVASTAHNAARKGIPFDDLQSERHYRGMRVYGQSKLANILFTLELARRLEGRASPRTPSTPARCAPATAATAMREASSPSGSRSPAPSSCRRPRGPAPRCTWRRPPRWTG